MDDSLLDVMKEMAMSLQRIATALEASQPTGRVIQDSKSNDRVEHRHRPVDMGSHPSERNNKMYRDADSYVDAHDRRDILRTFLSTHGISITTERERDDADEVLDRLAVFVGARYQHVRTFYRQLKRSMNHGSEFTLDLSNEPQDVVSSTCQLATELYAIAFLERYTYRKAPEYLLRARPSRLPKALNFLSGGWLERYAVTQALEAARTCMPAVQCSHLKNPQITLPNGDDFELDVLFEAEGEVYWIELKTGDYQRHIAKYSRMSRLLGMNQNRCYMVLTDITPNRAAALSALFNMTVVSVDNLGEALTQAMAEHLCVPETNNN